MKKLTFILAAAACLLLASCTTEYSCTYLLGHYVDKSAYSSFYSSTDSISTADSVRKEFTNEIIAYDKAHESEWEWTVTVTGDDYDKSDKEALAKYEKVVADIDAINSKYIELFKKCSDDNCTFEEVHFVELRRISNINATLGHKEFTISYGKK